MSIGKEEAMGKLKQAFADLGDGETDEDDDGGKEIGCCLSCLLPKTEAPRLALQTIWGVTER
jgi:hypothetical protein